MPVQVSLHAKFGVGMTYFLQAISEMVDESCQTERLRPCNKAIQYSPQELSPAEAEATMSHENMKEFVNQTIPRLVLGVSFVPCLHSTSF